MWKPCLKVRMCCSSCVSSVFLSVMPLFKEADRLSLELNPAPRVAVPARDQHPVTQVSSTAWHQVCSSVSGPQYSYPLIPML